MDIRIVGTGSAVPPKVLTNEMLSEMVDTSDEWIRSRTGIEARRISEGQTTRDLGCVAAKAALVAARERSGILPEQIGVVICASIGSKEQHCPSLACTLQRDLELREDILAFDLNAACSGFIFALITASQLLENGRYALVVGCEVLSQFMDFSDRSTCILFGDGAGAVVVAPANADSANAEPAATEPANIELARATSTQDFFWVSQVSGSELLVVSDYIYMDGQAVFKFAVEAIVNNISAVTAKAQVALDEVDLFICHQANERIIKSAAKRLGVPIDRFFMNLQKYGNTSAASIPLALDEAVRSGAIKPGMRIVMAGFGGGLTAGAVCFTWA